MYDSAYSNLILGIIAQAAEDYRHADKLMAKSKKMTEYVESKKAMKDDARLWAKINTLAQESARLQRNVRRFLNGDWFKELCELIDLDPDLTKRAVLEKWGARNQNSSQVVDPVSDSPTDECCDDI